MKDRLRKIQEEAASAIESAGSLEDAEAVRIKYLGKKGELTQILRGMGALSPEEKREVGQIANVVRTQFEETLNAKMAAFKEAMLADSLKSETIDVTEPGEVVNIGSRHLITIAIGEIEKIFASMGFSSVEGPEVETVFNNFDALNASPGHPSRDETDTFYIDDEILLRTQTSPVQVRTLLAKEPPIKVIAPGRCFRCDTPDATHSPMFHQVEGLLVDKDISMADLKGVLNVFAHEMFGKTLQTRFRPHHFPFTEPSAEMDVSCFKCGGSGCRVCKGTGWIEILGCGMVHPNVLAVGGVDTEVYTGFAFGMGVERIAMLKYEVEDIRLFYENDIRFIRQFI